MMRQIGILSSGLAAVLVAVTGPVRAATVETRVVWVEAKPRVEVAIDGELPPGTKEVALPLELFDAQNVRLWNVMLKVAITGERPWKARVPLEKIQDEKKQHRLTINLLDDALGIDYSEEITFGLEAAVVQSHGLRTQGAFPNRKVYFTLGLNAFKGSDLRDIPVALSLRDGEDNLVWNRQAAVRPVAEPRRHLLDVTPDPTAVGPFRVEATIESDGYNLFFNAGMPFGHANAAVPVTSMEHGDPGMWFAAQGQPQSYRSFELYLPGQEQLYYSPQLTDLLPRDNPRVSYDPAVKRSGRQGLRADYLPVGETYLWSQQELPGKPLALTFWVKGNESQDQLILHFEDKVNYAALPWQRRAHFSTVPLGSLDFAGWRRYRVPVLGNGLQVKSHKGSTDKIDAPIRIMGFTIKPGPLPKDAPKDQRRTFWLDDFTAETQAAPGDLVTMEAQASDAAGRLTADGHIAVAVGNGNVEELKRGKLTVLARDGAGNPAWTKTLDLVVPGQGWMTADVPLGELAAKKPAGPVTVELAFQDPTRPGARVNRQFMFKAPGQAGIVHDFEEPVSFSGYQPGKVGKSAAHIVEGGADGSAHALALPVKPNNADNSVLFHPALPGLVDRVELMVQGGAKPVTLQAWFIDSGHTGVTQRPYNLFWPEPVTVDWQGWRKVIIQAPAIPPHQGDKDLPFLFRPWYPLNLALNARLTEGDEPVEFRIDNIRVVTHLPEEEHLAAEVEFLEENRIHPSGAPLRLLLHNFAGQSQVRPLVFKLTNYQGFVARNGKLDVTIPAGAKHKVTLIDALTPGIYDLEVTGLGPRPLRQNIMVLDARKYFGADPGDLLTNSHLLRRQLNLTTERLYLDWDNTEGAPNMYHYNWFEQEVKKRRQIQQLPKELEPLFVRQTETAAAVTQLERDLKAAQDAVATAQRNEKPANDKLATTLKNLDMARSELQAAQKQLETTTAAADKAAKEAADAKMMQAEAAKTVQKADTAAKTALAAAPVADKLAVAAEMAAKTAEAPVKAAQDAATAAEQELSRAEATLKDAQASKDPRQIDHAQLQLQAARKNAPMAKMKADDLCRAAEAKRADAVKAKAAAETAQKDAKTLMAQAAAAQKAAADAGQRLMAVDKVAAAAKAEQNKADQRTKMALKRVEDLDKMATADRQILADRMKQSADAAAKVDATGRDLETARTTAATALQSFDEARARYDFALLPVVGFSADWAGPEAIEGMLRGNYMRWIPNLLQVPRRDVDWSLFVRTIQREYRGPSPPRASWENPDLDEAPQSLPPPRYAAMLGTFSRWVKLYNPQAKVVAGGFNFHKALGYLRRIPDVDRLPFEEIHVQMNLGELSPEHADVEGFLDDLNDLLKVRDTGRVVRITELDWGIGPYTSAMQQAANHARATLILASRGVPEHQFNLINTGFEFDGYGVFYRVPYGNTAELQTFKPVHVPKPAYFALMETRAFLKDWQFVASASPPDQGLAHNRAFLYKNAAGEFTVVLWRAVEGSRTYRLPTAWQSATATDVFGFPVLLAQGLNLTPLPVRVRLPAGYALEPLLHDLRTLAAADGSHPVTLDLHLAEPDSRRRAGYQSTGSGKPVVRSGPIAGDRKVREPFLEGLETESFSFPAAQAGNFLLRRLWHFDGEGQKLYVRLNDGPEQPWELTKGQGNEAGPRESTLILRGCKSGDNRVAIRYDKPGNCAGYRVEPLAGDHVPLVRWGVLNTRQTRGDIALHTSAVGTPLTFGKVPAGDGIGAHAVSFIEYPLDGQFRAFEVTVGIDGSTEGRGSVIFRVFVDGKERANSGLITGFSKPLTLKVDQLENARRLILSVTDAEDGNRDDLANWVDGKLYLK